MTEAYSKVTDNPNTHPAPGNYGVFCRQCGKPALYFAHQLPDQVDEARRCLDRRLGYEKISQRGPHPTEPGKPWRCQHCAAKVSAPGGIIPGSRIQPVAALKRSMTERVNAGRARFAYERITDDMMGLGLVEGDDPAPKHPNWLSMEADGEIPPQTPEEPQDVAPEPQDVAPEAPEATDQDAPEEDTDEPSLDILG